MELGMYTPELERDGLADLFHAIHGFGFTLAQLDFRSVLGEDMPAHIPAELTARIGAAARQNGVRIVAVNGTFNMIHPDVEVRREGVRRFETIARAARELGSPLVSLCTGSRSREGMWRRHEDNDTPEAWSDLAETLRPVILIAERYDLDLGVECEASNVVSSPERARRLLDEMRSPRLRIIMDPANLFQAGEARVERVRPILRRAFDLLAKDIALAHGKDILSGDGLRFTSAGRGIVDFRYFFELLHESGYAGGLILHGIKREEEFRPAVDHINRKIREAGIGPA